MHAWDTLNVNDRGFETAPVFLGSEGGVAILGSDVPWTLALLARCGSDELDGALDHGGGDDAEPSEAATAWVAKTFGPIGRARP